MDQNLLPSLACAVTAGVDAIISGDKDLLSLGSFQGIPIINAAQDTRIAAGAKRRTRPRLGQSGTETGQHYWVGKECREKRPALAPKARKPKS